MATISKELVSYLTISENEAEQRLDNFLIKILKGVPKSHIHRVIRAGEVRINKKRAKADQRLNIDDVVRIPPMRIAQHIVSKELAPSREFTIVFEDDVLLVINKPAGVAVHGGSGVNFGVIEQLRQARPQQKYLELVHRLDKDTSGLLMIAKKRRALVQLHEEMRNHHLKKIYLALAVGDWYVSNCHVRLPLIKYTGSAGEKMVRVHEQGQAAHTVFRVLEKFSGALLYQHGIRDLSLLEVTLKTGRTHQIRVHMQSQSCPIAGDERYGDYQSNRRLQKMGLKRMFLHAHYLEITHPLTGKILHLRAPLPDELSQFINKLKQ